MTISKTDYLIYRDCPKNAWLKIHKPAIYKKYPLSSFEKLIIQTGNEVEDIARELFPTGVLIHGRDEDAEEETAEYLEQKESTLFQPIFHKEGFLAAVDVLKLDEETGKYTICEIKATNDIDEKVHFYDLAFQVNLLRMCGLDIERMQLLYLNKDYIREGDLEITKLFKIDDVSSEIEDLCPAVAEEMEVALSYLSSKTEPKGRCSCVFKGRSSHCTTFEYSNPDIPEYGVHDISRIGASKAKLRELIDGNIFELHKIPDGMDFSDTQQNQIDAHVFDKVTIDKESIREELEKLVFPLYFLDYETFPSAIPRFDGFSPYQQIPFQYSLHVLHSPNDKEPEHFEFLYSEEGDPTMALVDSLQQDIGPKGSVIVWNKGFERGRNEEMAARIPEAKKFIDSVNSRLYDLIDVFKKQYYVDKNFRGKTSIKKVLPVLAPELSYKNLEIKEGGTASESWNKITTSNISKTEKNKIIKDLKTYCGLDSYAMYAIWKTLEKL